MIPPGESVPAAASRERDGAGAGLGSQVLRNTGVLAVSGLVVRGLGLGMVVLLARYLGAEGYGTYQRAEAFVFLFAVLASLGLDMVLTREVARDHAHVPEYLSGVMLLKLLLAPVCFALILGFAHARGYSGVFLWGIGCYSAVLLLTVLAQSYDAVFQGLGDMSFVAIANIANQVVYVALGLACVMLGKDLRWILATLVVAGAVRLAVSAHLASRRRIAWVRPRSEALRFLLGQSIPIAFSTSFVIVYQQLDTILLGELKGNAQVGWYRAGAKFLLFYTMLRDSFLVAIYPVFSSVAHGDRERMGRLVTQAVRGQMIVALYFIVCFTCLPRMAPRLFGGAFESTAAILPIMALLLVPQTLSITLGRVLFACGAQKAVMIATALTLVVNVALNLALIPRYGYVGAAIAGAISELVVAGVNAYYVRRFVTGTHMLRTLVRPFVAAVAAGAVLRMAPGLHLIQALALAGTLYAAGLLVTGTFSRVELRHAWAMARAGLARPAR